jgi:L-serine dehydratase
MARDLMEGRLTAVTVRFDPDGSLATTHESQGSDMGLLGGLLGYEADDERLTASPAAIREAGIAVRFEIGPTGARHPSAYALTLENGADRHTLTALSTGGGMIEVTEVDGARLSMAGDCCETLLYGDGAGALAEHIESRLRPDAVLALKGGATEIVEVKTPAPLDGQTVSELRRRFPIRQLRRLGPVLPVLTRKGATVPFLTCDGMLRYAAGRELPLWELAVRYESDRSSMPPDLVLRKMAEIVDILGKSARQGIEGTHYADRILDPRARDINERIRRGGLLDAGMLNSIILHVTALMEVKSSMGVIVAAPTAGSCGALPGACLGAGAVLRSTREELAQALMAAGLVGVFIAARATFSAEIGGCQAECGAASGMAAAALVTLARGTLPQAVAAASMALQNTLGMICDPVANRVEVPCLGKNIMAAANALACANLALAGGDPVIPLDEVIETMDRVGKSLPAELRCTALGGLSVTRTSREIEERLKRRSP